MKWETGASSVQPQSQDHVKALKVFLFVRWGWFFFSHLDMLRLWPAVFLRGVVWCPVVCHYQRFPLVWPKISLVDLLRTLTKKEKKKIPQTQNWWNLVRSLQITAEQRNKAENVAQHVGKVLLAIWILCLFLFKCFSNHIWAGAQWFLLVCQLPCWSEFMHKKRKMSKNKRLRVIKHFVPTSRAK